MSHTITSLSPQDIDWIWRLRKSPAALNAAMEDAARQKQFDPQIPRETLAREVAREAIQTIVHELAHEVDPGHGQRRR
jgi:hypothetical protein